jgi:integrase
MDGEGATEESHPDALSFASCADRWLQDQLDRVETQKKRCTTLTTDRFKLAALKRHFSTCAVSSIGTADVVRYQKQRLTAGRKPPTINGEVALLKQVLSWLAEQGAIDRIPKIEQIPVRRTRVELPTMAEVAQILERLPDRVSLLVRLLAETGCRKSEAFALEWSDVRSDLGVIMIRRKEGFTPKTDHSDRDVPVGPALFEALEEAKRRARASALQRGEPMSVLVFPGRTGGRMHNFSKALATAIKAADVKRNDKPLHLNAKAFRKAHVTWQKQRGVDDSLLQPRIGHAPGSRVTAAIYTHVMSEAARSIILNLPLAGEQT